ncbi:hypothetical protein N0B44_06445 [Roseibacterium beibuensis]|uniref:hypothetical protein n=1 Tax=[Roseibacterium] beibuensis TaxID=1193142 RepID=UPI00217F0F89|nr:hypothetical protein [Roseibacterium beibuensis]MCS6622541.1 hypothetical protein [Roseibacterium beibuensis]
MTRKILAAAAALLTAVAAPVPTFASEPLSMTFKLRGTVPVACRVQLPSAIATPDGDGIAQLGVAEEFCNAPRGYRVLILHPAGLEGAAILRDGVRIPLSPTGSTVLTDSRVPAIQQVALAVDLGDTPARFNRLMVRIEART